MNNMVWFGLVIMLMLMILYVQKHEQFTAVVDPEQYVNSVLTAKY